MVPGERWQVASLSDPAEGMRLGPYHLAEGREEEKVLGKCGRFRGWSKGGEAWEALAQNQPRPPHLEAQPWGVGSLWSSQSPHPLHLRQEGPCPAPGGHACSGLRCVECYGVWSWILGSASVHRAGDPGWLSSKCPFRAWRWQWMVGETSQDLRWQTCHNIPFISASETLSLKIIFAFNSESRCED